MCKVSNITKYESEYVYTVQEVLIYSDISIIHGKNFVYDSCALYELFQVVFVIKNNQMYIKIYKSVCDFLT